MHFQSTSDFQLRETGPPFLCDMPWLKLVRNMRVLEDPVFIHDETQLKRTDEADVQYDPPGSLLLLRSLGCLSDVLHLSQLRALAVEFDLVLVCWPEYSVSVASLGMRQR